MTRNTACYVDPADGTEFDLEKPLWRSPAGNPLMISDLPGIDPAKIDRSVRSIWRYQAALPVTIPDPITMGEGLTPLVRKSIGAGTYDFKLEWFAPTGSFKDRGASVMISYLRQSGIGSILEDSSGNGGSAMAAYGAAGGVSVRILTPATTQPAKIAQMRAFGAEVQLVPGPREESENEAIRQSEDRFYASHNWQAFFLQGTKTLAYELWEDYGFAAPDNIVIPVGAGSNVLGCDIGFGELLRSGCIDALPRLFCVQPENCAPLHAALHTGSEDGSDNLTVAPTIAEGTAIKRPVRAKQVLNAIRRSGGTTIAVSDDSIRQAVRSLAAEGLYAEPTSAVAFAGAEALRHAGRISTHERTVVLLTGSGLKASAAMTDLFLV